MLQERLNENSGKLEREGIEERRACFSARAKERLTALSLGGGGGGASG